MGEATTTTQLTNKHDLFLQKAWDPNWNKNCVNQSMAKLEVIHVGKCGGTFIHKWMKFTAGFQAQCYHQSHLRPVTEMENTGRQMYILWVRHPLQRFNSAFDFKLALSLTNMSKMYNKQGNPKMCTLGPGNKVQLYMYAQTDSFI